MLCFLSFFFTTMSKTREEDEEVEADGANYQLEMMRCLREVNVDNNTVGWYVINVSFLVEFNIIMDDSDDSFRGYPFTCFGLQFNHSIKNMTFMSYFVC